MPRTRNNNSMSDDGERSSNTGGALSRNERQTKNKEQTDRTDDGQTGKIKMNRSFFFQFNLHCCVFHFFDKLSKKKQ